MNAVTKSRHHLLRRKASRILIKLLCLGGASGSLCLQGFPSLALVHGEPALEEGRAGNLPRNHHIFSSRSHIVGQHMPQPGYGVAFTGRNDPLEVTNILFTPELLCSLGAHPTPSLLCWLPFPSLPSLHNSSQFRKCFHSPSFAYLISSCLPEANQTLR